MSTCSDHLWELQSSVPFECFSEPISYTDTEFIFAPYKWIDSDFNHNVEGIYKYNVKYDKWTEWIKYPQDRTFITSVHSTAINKNKNILYIYNAQRKLITIDLTTGSVDIDTAPINVSNYAKSIVIKNKLHVIGGSQNCTHFVINSKKHYETLYTFEKHGDRLYGHCLIHLKSQQCLLLLGGEDKWRNSDDIYRYSLLRRKWELLTVKLPEELSQFGYIVTNDDKYVIIFGGINAEGSSDKIYILNTMRMQWAQSEVFCPDSYRFHAFITRNIHSSELLIHGFIKKICRSKKFKKRMFLPMDVINVVIKYHTVEYVHLLEHFRYGNHWKITLMDLM